MYLLISCSTYYKTEKLSKNYQLEIYNRYPDCRDFYISDSSKKKIFLTSQDLEHEYIEYTSKNDSLYLLKIETFSKNCCDKIDSNVTRSFDCEKDTVCNKKLKLSELF